MIYDLIIHQTTKDSTSILLEWPLEAWEKQQPTRVTQKCQTAMADMEERKSQRRDHARRDPLLRSEDLLHIGSSSKVIGNALV